jgi:CheY-like chemotaxis protein
VSEDKSPIAGKRFLVLDDEFLIALDIQQILESAGAAHVIAVNSADDALSVLREGVEFDLAVLDVQLGQQTKTGLLVATELARQTKPFIFLTGLNYRDAHARHFPDVPVVEKPYQASVLLEAVLRALHKR